MKKSSIIIIEGDILKGKTHVLYGLTTGLALGMNLPQLTILTLGALLPDIDHEKSAIGHCIPIISKDSHHRGFYHSALFAALCFVLSPYLGIGVLSHIVLDMFNVVGVELLWPIRIKIKAPGISIHTGKSFETLIYAAGILGLGLLIGFYHHKYGMMHIMEYTKLGWEEGYLNGI